MKSMIVVTTLLGMLGLVSGCAHSHTRGAIVTLDDEKEGHVCLGSSEVKSGDRLRVFESMCTKRTIPATRGPRTRTECEKVERGYAEVVSVDHQEHFSKIRASDKLRLKEGLIVEKVE